MKQLGPHSRQLVRLGCVSIPTERVLVELERPRPRTQRVLLVAEDGSCEQVEEAMLAGGCRIRVMQPCRRLEDEPALAAAADERRELLDGRNSLAPTAHLC